MLYAREAISSCDIVTLTCGEFADAPVDRPARGFEAGFDVVDFFVAAFLLDALLVAFFFAAFFVADFFLPAGACLPVLLERLAMGASFLIDAVRIDPLGPCRGTPCGTGPLHHPKSADRPAVKSRGVRTQ